MQWVSLNVVHTRDAEKFYSFNICGLKLFAHEDLLCQIFLSIRLLQSQQYSVRNVLIRVGICRFMDFYVAIIS